MIANTAWVAILVMNITTYLTVVMSAQPHFKWINTKPFLGLGLVNHAITKDIIGPVILLTTVVPHKKLEKRALSSGIWHVRDRNNIESRYGIEFWAEDSKNPRCRH